MASSDAARSHGEGDLKPATYYCRLETCRLMVLSPKEGRDTGTSWVKFAKQMRKKMYLLLV